jgi:hypothetical protein
MSLFRGAYAAGLSVFGDRKTAIAFAKSKCRMARNPSPFPPDSYFELEPKRRPTDEELELASYNRQRKWK